MSSCTGQELLRSRCGLSRHGKKRNSYFLRKGGFTMKETVKVAVVQFAPSWLEPEANASQMAQLADGAAAGGAELVVFPELANVGYIAPFHGLDMDFATKYVAAAESRDGPTVTKLCEIATQRSVHIVVGFAEKHQRISGSVYNSAALIGPAGLVGIQRKVHIPAGEKHYFTPGDAFHVFATELGNIGISICYDGRFPETARCLSLDGAEIICSIWARAQISGYLSGEGNHSLAFVRAQENALFYIFCNRSGAEGDSTYLGHSAIAAPNGELVAVSGSTRQETISATLSADTLASSRAFLSIYRDRRPEVYNAISRAL